VIGNERRERAGIEPAPRHTPRPARLASLGRAAARSLIAPGVTAARFDRPIFILAPPRSGSTLLFECLAQFEGTAHLGAESDLYWWRRAPYGPGNGYSDHLRAASLGETEVRLLCRDLYRHAVINGIKRRQRLPDPAGLLGLRRIRYLDKTIANCFHLEVLERVFPGARYVHLVRDPRATIASMIEGWPHVHRFGKPQLTPIVQTLEPRTIEHWTYPAPPGWQGVVGRPLAEICAWSWQQHVEHVLRFFEGRAVKPLRITYEELVGDPVAAVRRLGDALGLGRSERAERHARAAPLSRTTLSPPAAGKWRASRGAEVERVLPLIRETAASVGYRLDLGR
jgi:hypothetical protein